MFKALTMSVMFACCQLMVSQAQTVPDSLIKKANVDARTIRLTKTQYKMFRKSNSGISSDLFKPNKTTTPDTSLLNDSVYVDAFRIAAYQQAVNKPHVNHHGNALLASLAAGIVGLAALAGISALIREVF